MVQLRNIDLIFIMQKTRPEIGSPFRRPEQLLGFRSQPGIMSVFSPQLVFGVSDSILITCFP